MMLSILAGKQERLLIATKMVLVMQITSGDIGFQSVCSDYQFGKNTILATNLIAHPIIGASLIHRRMH